MDAIPGYTIGWHCYKYGVHKYWDLNIKIEIGTKRAVGTKMTIGKEN